MSDAPSITKAILAVAGMGTRFLPATKAMPKEMLPVVDKPVIQYVVEDAVAAGVRDIIMVTGWHKRILEDHFDYPYELISRLKEAGKDAQVELVQQISDLANFSYLRQKGHLGNATPVLNAAHLVNDEPFLYLFGDDFFVSTPTRSQQLVAAYEEFKAPILAAITTDNPEDTKRYGYVAGEMVRPGVMLVKDIIEKPGPDKAPSNMAVVSGYVFTPTYLNYMQQVEPREGEELVYVEGLKKMIEDGHEVYALEIADGRYYDCGNKLEYLKTNVEIALQHPNYADDLRDYLKSLDL